MSYRMTRREYLEMCAAGMREEMEPMEAKLWFRFLQYYPAKVERQRVFGRYILDFYVPSAKLAIEVDGSQHYRHGDMLSDWERTDRLAKAGVRVIRFSNAQVRTQFRAVCEKIDDEIQNGRKPSSASRSAPRPGRSGYHPLGVEDALEEREEYGDLHW